MSQILEGTEGVFCHMDDVLVYDRNKEEHDDRLRKVLQRIQDAGITMNKEKCKFNKEKLVFFGHIIDKDGISPDSQDKSYYRDGQTQDNNGTMQVFRDGKSNGKIFTKPCYSIKTITGSTKQKAMLELEFFSGDSFSKDKDGTNKPSSASTLQCRG